MTMFFKLIYGFNIILVNFPEGYSEEIKSGINLYMKIGWTQQSNVSLKKKEENFRELTFLNFKTNYKATMCYWHKGRHIEQLNKAEGSEINPYFYG